MSVMKSVEFACYRFSGSRLKTINVGDWGNFVGDITGVKRNLAVMKIIGVIRYEGSDKNRIWVISIMDH